MGSTALRLRAAVLVLAGAIALHDLRYLLAGRHQDEHAHAYMGWLVPVVCALVVLAAGEFAFRLLSPSTAARRAMGAGGVRWLTLSTLLVGIFALQEAVELLLVHGHIHVAESLIGHGGWLGLPLAFAVGGVIAALLRTSERLLTRISPALGPSGRRAASALSPAEVLPPRLAALACHQAGRAPPRS